MTNRILATALPVGVAIIGLSACSVEATVTGEKLAGAAADALEEQIGKRPDVDCGDDTITIEADKKVDCLLTDPETGSEFDVAVTFTGVDGDEWNIDVKVAEEPNNADAGSDAPSDAPTDGGGDDAGLEVTPDELAEAAADALEKQVGKRPEIDCGDTNLTIYENRMTYCDLNDTETGETFEVTITVTSINGESFNFDIAVAEQPK